ncbi:MAG: DUF3782 domain-containing protein [Desulfobacteraceae bacterium]
MGDQNRRWEEQNRKWEANQKNIEAMLAEIRAQSKRHDSSIGALGARWGLYSEQSFRNGLTDLPKPVKERATGVSGA